jgi:hypothetical protein
MRKSERSGRQRGLGLVDDGFERRRLVDGEVGKHLTIDRDPGFGEAVDKSAVGEPELAHRRVQALDPQRPEGTLAALAVPEGVLVRLLDRLLGDANGILAPAVIALGGFEDFLVLGVSGDAPFDAGQGGSPLNLAVDKVCRLSRARRAPGRQALGIQYFLTLSPSVLNNTLVPR